jgi:hypothetical protein
MVVLEYLPDSDRPSFAMLQRRMYVAQPTPALAEAVPVTYVAIRPAVAGPLAVRCTRLHSSLGYQSPADYENDHHKNARQVA